VSPRQRANEARTFRSRVRKTHIPRVCGYSSRAGKRRGDGRQQGRGTKVSRHRTDAGVASDDGPPIMSLKQTDELKFSVIAPETADGVQGAGGRR